MLYVHSVENGNDCNQIGVHGGNKNYVPNTLSSMVLAHNQTIGFQHPTVTTDETNIVTNNNNQWIGHVSGASNGDPNGTVVNPKTQFDAGDLSHYERDGFGGHRETENVRSFSVNKLLQINNGNQSECMYLLMNLM